MGIGIMTLSTCMMYFVLFLTLQLDIQRCGCGCGGVWGLMPKKMPNGGARKFLPNVEEPRHDLLLISAGSASLITKNWMQNILLDVMTRRRAKEFTSVGEFVYDDLHIMSAIQQLQKEIDFSQKKSSKTWSDVMNVVDSNALYFAWKPKSREGFNEVLFIVVATVVEEVSESESESGGEVREVHYYLDIKNVIQSPFWDEEQIPSIYLKQSLIDQNTYTNQTILRFDTLYERNLRYKLAWDTWFKEMNLSDNRGKWKEY